MPLLSKKRYLDWQVPFNFHFPRYSSKELEVTYAAESKHKVRKNIAKSKTINNYFVNHHFILKLFWIESNRVNKTNNILLKK